MKQFGDPTPIQRDYLIEEFLAEASMAPRGSIHVQADSGMFADPPAETAFVANECNRVGHPVRIVGLAALDDPKLEQVLDAHMAHPEFCGVRQIVGRLEHRADLNFADRDLMADPQWVKGLSVLEERGLTFDLQLYPEQAELAMEALSATPALTVIIDHALCPYDPTAEGYERWCNALALMAGRKNTFIKTSGWGMYLRDWATNGGAGMEQPMDDLLMSFGADRLMWGSNFPVEKIATPYESCLRASLNNLPAEDREMIFKDVASRAYGLTLT